MRVACSPSAMPSPPEVALTGSRCRRAAGWRTTLGVALVQGSGCQCQLLTGLTWGNTSTPAGLPPPPAPTTKILVSSLWAQP